MADLPPSDPGDAPELRPLTVGRLLGRGLLRRCPLCGGGDSFEGYFRMRERCPRCNLRFDRIDGQRVGALGINTIVTFGTLFVVIAGGLALSYPEFRVAPVLVAGILVSVVVPIAFYPFSRAIWNSIDLAMRPIEPGDDVDLRWVPPPRRRPRR